MRKSCRRSILVCFVALATFSGCTKVADWSQGSPNWRLLWIADESWSDNASKAHELSQHRLLTGISLVRFAGLAADRRVVPFLASDWDSADEIRWKFSVNSFFDSKAKKISIPEFVDDLRDRLEARATPCGPGTKDTDPLARVVQRTFPAACEGRRFRLLPEAITASQDAVTIRTAGPAAWLPWLLAQASLWVGAPGGAGEASYGEFRWVESGKDFRKYRRNPNFPLQTAANYGRSKSVAGPIRDLELQVRLVSAPELRAAYVEEGYADLIDGVEATWARPKSSRLVENEDGWWLMAHDVAKPALDCDLLRRQTGQHWVAVDESERRTSRFLLEHGGEEGRRVAALPEDLRDALSAQAYVATMDDHAAPSLAGFSLFGFSGVTFATLPVESASTKNTALSARCSRRRLSVRGSRLDELRAGVWEPGAGWNIAADTSGAPSAMLYGQGYWPVDKR